MVKGPLKRSVSDGIACLEILRFTGFNNLFTKDVYAPQNPLFAP